MENEIKLKKRGQCLAFVIALATVLGAFTAIFLGYDIAGLGALFLGLTSLIAPFIYAKLAASKESKT